MKAVISAALICLTATAAQAQGMPQCADREALVQFLADKYGEALDFNAQEETAPAIRAQAIPMISMEIPTFPGSFRAWDFNGLRGES